MEAVPGGGGIVVGVDGSACARTALAWAGRLAGRAGMPLRAVRAWSLTTAPRPASWEPAYVPPLAEYEAAVRQAIDDEVAAAGLPADVPVTCSAVHRAPVDALLAAAEGADLLVVGVRGRGGARGRLLGSVAASVLRAADCPVTVVRPSGTTPGPGPGGTREERHESVHTDAR
ncbi:universal stress protein [Geodermatophilus amargosae]|uniref:universal stress protein n=1 Tax=Geodermatophilus amargosae TaxID=1296565 RepID=UPI0034DF5721